MSTSTAVAKSELAKVLSDNEDYVLSVTKSKAVDLSDKMFQSCLISDSMMDQFSSLDHSRVEPQLQLRYLFRLVNQRIQQDESVGDRFLSLLESWGEQPLCEYLKRNSSEEKQPQVKRIRLDDCFCSDDISWILEILVDASHKWEALAIALGLRTYQRHNIKGDDNISKLTKVLDVWLSGGSTTPPTVNTLINALRSKTVGQGRLALEVEERYKAINTVNGASNIKIHDTSNSPFMIIHQSPRTVEVEDGKSTILMIQASSRENVSYQWNKNGQPLADNISLYVANQPCYSGVHEDMLFINHAHQGTQGEYTCCVSNEERQVVSNKVTLTVLYTPEKELLIKRYSSVNTQVPLDEAWPPVGAEKFIKLILDESRKDWSSWTVDRNPYKMINDKEEIQYNNLFIAYRSASLLLIEGRPGSGKTTLVCKLIKDWVEGIVLVQAKLVFLVSLCTLKKHHSPKNTLYKLLQPFYSCRVTLRKVVSHIKQKNGEGVCFVFDGLDEYHPHKVNKSVVFRILRRRYLSQAMIIVSSRPGAMRRLKQEVVTQHIEVLGFTKKQISEYIDKFPFDSSLEPSQLKEYLRLHPILFHMCYLPIHSAIICFVYNIKRGHLPHTQTKIYEEFTKSMILRHLRRTNAEVQLHSLKELPGDVREHFSKLCLLAFDMTIELKQVINSNEITFSDTSLHGDRSLGLVTCNRTAQLSGVSTSYMFLHLTLQEFLAAYYITSAEEEKKHDLIEKLMSNKLYTFQNVLTFCFGLETFLSQKVFNIYRKILQVEEKKNFMAMVNIMYAFESQQQIVCDEVMRLSDGKITTFTTWHSDIPAFEFIISNSTQLVRELEFRQGLYSRNAPIPDILEQIRHVKFLQLERLTIYHDSFMASFNTRTLQNLSIILQSCGQLRHLKIHINFTEEAEEVFADSMKYLNQLELLDLKTTGLRIGMPSGYLIIIKKLHFLTQLKKLKLSGLVMDLQCCRVLASNLCHVFNLEELALEETLINSEGAISLISELHHLIKLERLNLGDNQIGPEGASSLACALHHFIKLKSLNLSHNKIGSGSIILASALHYRTNLERIDLRDNIIGSEGAISLASALHHLTELQSVDLSHNAIGSEGATSLASALHHLTELQSLDLSHNAIGSEGATLASALHHLTELHSLDLSHNTIGLTCAISLVSALHHLTKFEYLSLSENNIDADGAIKIITALKDCQILKLVKLNKNPIWNFCVRSCLRFHLEGLVTSDESATIDSLVSAAKLHKRDIDLHFGFKTINIQPNS